MNEILIIKTGETFPELADQRGDFEDWILNGMGLEHNAVGIVDVSNHAQLPDYEEISGIVITGSHEMVTDQHDWSDRTAQWLAKAVEREIPILGICYGHQLLAYALGGRVANNPNGKEFGTVKISMTPAAKDDPLFGGLPNPFEGHVCHAQSVLELPFGARLLASSNMDPHQAFVVGKNAWGVQFHPEFDAEILKKYITTYQQDLEAQGVDPQELLDNCHETPYSSSILRRFYEIICKRASSDF